MTTLRGSVFPPRATYPMESDNLPYPPGPATSGPPPARRPRDEARVAFRSGHCATWCCGRGSALSPIRSSSWLIVGGWVSSRWRWMRRVAVWFRCRHGP